MLTYIIRITCVFYGFFGGIKFAEYLTSEVTKGSMPLPVMLTYVFNVIIFGLGTACVGWAIAERLISVRKS